jgi:glycosyltransferase involved in cell wall biosynthesis
MKVPTLHHSNYLQTPGGMQRIIHLHLRGGNDHAIAFRDPVQNTDRVNSTSTGLGAVPGTSIRQIRERYAGAVADIEAEVSVYHNCWGVELVHDLDPAPFRVGYLHSDFPHFNEMLLHFAPYFDAFVNINPGLHRTAMELLPDWPQERFILLDSPVEFPDKPLARPDSAQERCVIGIAGRIKRAQKRLDRLPAFLDACDAALVDYEVQLLGSGDYEPELRRQLEGRTSVRFLGWQEGEDYWKALAGWRYMLFLSDYEGTPLSLLEGIWAGVEPIYPDFHPGSIAPGGLLADHLYPPGDTAAAAAVIARLEALGVAKYRLPGAGDVENRHHPDRYLKHFSAALNSAAMAAMPPLPGLSLSQPEAFADWANLMLYNWNIKRLRFGWSGILWHS